MVSKAYCVLHLTVLERARNSKQEHISSRSTGVQSFSLYLISVRCVFMVAGFITPTLDGTFTLNESLPVIIFAYEPTGIVPG